MQFALHGIMFVLLGEQLPAIFASAVEVVQQSDHDNPWWLAAYVLTINLSLAALRFAWVWVSMKGAAVSARRRGATPHEPTPRLVAAMSVAGARGAITLAGVLTMPLVLSDGTPFPARGLAIFIAAGVIILSLLAANLALPRLLAGLEMPSDDHGDGELDEARKAASEAAILAVEAALHDMAKGHKDADFYAEAAARVMERYRRRVEGHATGENATRVRHIDRIERRLRLVGLRAERDTLYALARAQHISDASCRKLVWEVDLVEQRFH